MAKRKTKNSNLTFLIVAVVVVVIVSTWMIVDSALDTKLTTGVNGQSGEVSVTVEESDYVPEGELDSEGSASIYIEEATEGTDSVEGAEE